MQISTMNFINNTNSILFYYLLYNQSATFCVSLAWNNVQPEDDYKQTVNKMAHNINFNMHVSI